MTQNETEIKPSNLVESKKNQTSQDYSSKNKWHIKDGIIYITTNKGVTKVNEKHKDLVLNTTWFVVNGYVLGSVKGKKVRLHRLITNAPEGMVVDHANHDKLDNTDGNISVCTHKKNMWNFKKQKGIGFSKRDNKWRARIERNKKEFHLGFFNTYSEALEVRLYAEQFIRERNRI